jgi:hypothetical protein
MKTAFLLLVAFVGFQVSALADDPCDSLRPIAIAWAQGKLGLGSDRFDAAFSQTGCVPRAGYFSEDEQPWVFTFESKTQTCVVSVITGTERVSESNCY